MELKVLSSNWKKLQESLQKDQTVHAATRKASKDILQPQRNGVKRQKANHKPPRALQRNGNGIRQRKGMGLGSSKGEESAPSASLALWAEDNDIPAEDLKAAYGSSLTTTSLPNANYAPESVNEGLSPTAEAGRYLAIDCEMVGVGPNPDMDSALARVSVVNYHGQQLYDSFVLPKEAVTDFRTAVSGITPQLLRSARSLEVVQTHVAELLNGKILVGHAIRNDLDALMLGHPKRDIRDTSRYPGFRQLAGGKTPSLKRLAKEVLGVDIQGGEHSSVEDARATMLLFRREKDGFEKEHSKRWGTQRKMVVGVGDDEDGSGTRRSRKKKVKK
ncbi:3'-5' exonuclease [Lignoscripta atroalba]|nr:3'-5' exonuclease [Lignoscripta atroalba]